MNKTKLTHTFTKGLHLFAIAALLAGLALGLGPPPVAHADTFTVNDTGDAGDNNPGDGTCATAGGVCTLRAAIEEANALAGDDAINFSVTGTITLGGTELDIDSNITITGPGADQLTVNGNEASRVFYIESGTVAISGLTIADGDAGTGDGGGIWNDGDLTLTNCTVSGNEADDDGGGIYNEEDLTLTNCTVSGNEADDDGGGIYNHWEADLTLTNCTVSGNEAGDNGGGIYNRGDLTLTNCTVSGNEAGDNGGGIYNDEDTDFKNTILANNTATDSGPDCRGDPDSYGYNLVEDISDCTINEVENVGTNITGQDPKLGPLANNGGPTETHALLAGSPAIDAIPQAAGGDYNGAPATDQRGVPRPQGDNCDIGAFEAGPPILRVSKAGTGTGMVTSDQDGIDCGADCAEWYDQGTPVTLTATPDAGSVFAGWSGDCSGTNPTTTVTMDADKTCTATFNLWTPPVPIGGIVVPVNKLGLVVPWLGLAALASIAVLTVALVRRRRSA